MGSCWYFCFEIEKNILQKLALFNILLPQATLGLALVSGAILGLFLIITIDLLSSIIIKCYENDKKLKFIQLTLKSRRKYQKDRTLNNYNNLTTNQTYINFGYFCNIEINFLRDLIVTKREKPPGSRKYTVKDMFKDIALIGFVSLLLYSIGILLQIHLNLLLLLVLPLLTFSGAHLWIELVWPCR
jgi:hypothetical protein